MKKTDKNISELRQDLVSNDWMIVATARAKRSDAFSQKREKFEQPISQCPFENPEKNGNGKPLLIYKDGKDWSLQVIKNKFPIVGSGEHRKTHTEGPYHLMEGIGFHEIIITRDHKKHFALLPLNKVEEVIKAYQERYLSLMKIKYVNYVFIFHNHGKEGGATVPHPHSQLIAVPMVPSDVKRSLRGSKEYYDEHKKCVYCEMIKEEKDEKRIIFQNDYFIVCAPFVPRVNFEIRIYPKKHQSNFERTTNTERKFLAEALWQALHKLYKGLKDPSYNFYIHTAPCDEKEHSYYHWHIEILPKTNTWAGLELGTGIEVISIKPEEAAKFLRKIK